jgi:hypothetical protein
LRGLVWILRKVIPTILATLKDVLATEKTPEGSHRTPIPGTFPIIPEEPAAAEATCTDIINPELSPRQAQPIAARVKSDRTVIGCFNRDRAASLRRPPRLPPSSSPALIGPPRRGVYPDFGGRYPNLVTPMNILHSENQIRIRNTQICNLRRSRLPPYQGRQGTSPEEELAWCFGASFHERWLRWQLRCLGAYWNYTIPPFLDADGNELPMLELTPDQLDACRAFAQSVDPRYTMIAAIVLLRDDGQLLIAVRLEWQHSYLSSSDYGLVAANSSDGGLTWDIIEAKDERDGPARTLYVASPPSGGSVCLGSDPMDIDSSDVSMLDV